MKSVLGLLTFVTLENHLNTWTTVKTSECAFASLICNLRVKTRSARLADACSVNQAACLTGMALQVRRICEFPQNGMTCVGRWQSLHFSGLSLLVSSLLRKVPTFPSRRGGPRHGGHHSHGGHHNHGGACKTRNNMKLAWLIWGYSGLAAIIVMTAI